MSLGSRFNPLLVRRTGYALSTSETSPTTTKIFDVPPILIHSFAGGAGFKIQAVSAVFLDFLGTLTAPHTLKKDIPYPLDILVSIR
ncbi:hypothetical protein [Pajaroellobacter abortibovis]|uniref:hypothetical protein n=1 Tax=Pajaroellobacter abortibovis TaxID=1882918 RepID=UPI0012EC2B93|nr:hypothetical protein [Pajaroellobacter abortibovis]